MTLTERVLALIRHGLPLKNIADLVRRHHSSVSRIIRKAGYSAMYVTESERKQLLNQRGK